MATSRKTSAPVAGLTAEELRTYKELDARLKQQGIADVSDKIAAIVVLVNELHALHSALGQSFDLGHLVREVVYLAELADDNWSSSSMHC